MAKSTKGIKIAVIALVILLVVGGIGVYQLFFVHPKHTSTPTPLTSSLAQVWQTLFITNKDGSSYWVSPVQPFNLIAALESLLGSQSGTGSDFNTVATMQNNIYMSVNETGVSAWTYTCSETIQLWNMQGNPISTIVNNAPISNSSQEAVPMGQSIWITGATVPASNLQTLFAEPAGQYYFVITLANPTLTLTVNGQSQTLTSATTPTPNNTLQWLVKLT